MQLGDKEGEGVQAVRPKKGMEFRDRVYEAKELCLISLLA